MNEPDLPFVVTWHEHYCPEEFFARLGPGFLTEYYRGFLTTPAAVALIAEDDPGHPLGFLAGLVDPPAHRQHLLRQHGRRLAERALLALGRRPRLAAHFVRTRGVLYARKLLRLARASSRASGASSSGGPPRPAPPGDLVAVLSHVAVVPQAQGRGVGSLLIGEFEACAARAGRSRVQLVTTSGEDGAGPYYRHHGWQERGEHETPDGVRVTTYEHQIQPR
jgi:GNAT superfamily N-acetyltransferase